MVGVAQLVSAPDCGSGDPGFESQHSPFAVVNAVRSDMRSAGRRGRSSPAFTLGYRQGVKAQHFDCCTVGSNPTSPALEH